MPKENGFGLKSFARRMGVRAGRAGCRIPSISTSGRTVGLRRENGAGAPAIKRGAQPNHCCRAERRMRFVALAGQTNETYEMPSASTMAATGQWLAGAMLVDPDDRVFDIRATG
jgi:hypothetical protein